MSGKCGIIQEPSLPGCAGLFLRGDFGGAKTAEDAGGKALQGWMQLCQTKCNFLAAFVLVIQQNPRWAKTDRPIGKLKRINPCQTDESLADTGGIFPKEGYTENKQRYRKEIESMKMVNEQEMNLMSGGLGDVYAPHLSEYHEQCEKREQFLQEKKRLEGLADIRLRAGECALKAAMNAKHAELEMKAAQRKALGLD